MRRGLCVLLVLALGTTASAAAARTRVSVFSPWRTNGSPSIKVRDIADDATCEGHSQVADHRRDAFICQSEFKLLDPCFVSPRDRNSVICTSRDLKSGRRLHAFAKLPGRGGPPKLSAKIPPFNVELTNGDHCLYQSQSSGAVFSDGFRLNYACPGGVDLWGGFFKKRQPWTIRSVPQPVSSPRFARRSLAHVYK